MTFCDYKNKKFSISFADYKPAKFTFLILLSFLFVLQCDKNPISPIDEYENDSNLDDEVLVKDQEKEPYDKFTIPPGKTEKFIIVFKSEAKPKLIQEAGGKIRQAFNIIPAVSASISQDALNRLENSDQILRIERDGEIHALDYELDNSWGVKRIGSGSASNTGGGVKVGVADTGIDYNHTDLDDNYYGGYDFINDDNDPMDDNGHGTHVAGIIAAEDNDEGVVGVAPGARLYALKILDSGASGNWSHVIAALEWAKDNGIKIINHSYGSASYPGLSVEEAFENANSNGIFSVAAAGNSGNPSGSGDNIEYPGKFESVIAVAATDYFDNRSSFSSTGPTIELSAPGVSVNSTTIGGGYGKKSGTSTAAPHVAGALAIAKKAGLGNPRTILKNTANDLGQAGFDNLYGYGLVDAEEASIAPSTPPSVPNDPPVVTITQPGGGSSFPVGSSITFSATANDPENGNLTSFIIWISSNDGYLETGGDFSTQLSEGTHVISAKATDALGLSTTTTVTINVSVANTPPIVAIVQPTSGSSFTSSSNISFTANSTDAEDGNLSNQTSWSSNIDGALGVGSTLQKSLSVGTHQITAQVTDSSNQSANALIVVNVVTPNQSPSISIIQPSNGFSTTSGSVVSFSGNATDPEDGNLSNQISWVSNIDGALGVGSTLQKSLSVGTHQITAQVTDSSNQSANALIVVNVVVPNQPPSISIIQPSNGFTTTSGSVVSFSGNATDPEDGNLSNQISWVSNIDGLLGNGQNLQKSLGVGSHVITGSITDSANQTASTSVMVNVNAPQEDQNSLPEVIINAPNHNASFVVSDVITFSGSANDIEDGDLSNNIIWNSTLEGYLGQGSSLDLALVEGTHTIIAQVTDSQNASDSFTILVNVNDSNEIPTEPIPPPVLNNPPILIVEQPYSGISVYFGQPISFSGTASDSEDGDLSNQITWNSNLDGYLGAGTQLSYQLNMGSHVITAKVSDSENSIATKTLAVNVIEEEQNNPDPPPVPNNSPVLNISTSSNEGNLMAGEILILTGYAIDEEDGDISNGITWESNLDGYLGMGISLSVTLSNGSHKIIARVADSKNLTATASTTVTCIEEEQSYNSPDKKPNIYVSNIERTNIHKGQKIGEKIDVQIKIAVRIDSNVNGMRDSEDTALKNAIVQILITNTNNESWIMSGKTKSDGLAKIVLGRVPQDRYEISVLQVSHSENSLYNPVFGNETVSANYYLR
ncbi:S8 family serine peptidase [Candidatus Neomarinimicrobiota bacterium]